MKFMNQVCIFFVLGEKIITPTVFGLKKHR